MFKLYFIMGVFNSIRRFISGERSERLSDLNQDEFEKLKFKARIAVVDDEEIPHVKRLRNEGYNITDLNDIEVIDDFIRKRYHVVVLDIQGVGQKLAGKAEGWGILKYLKAECPHLVVIMFTGADWSVTRYKSQVDQADDFIGKDLEYLDFKSKLDSAIKKAFSPKFHFEITKRQLQSELSEDVLSRIEKAIQRHNGDKVKALKEIKGITTKTNVIGSIDTYLSIIDSIKDLVKE